MDKWGRCVVSRAGYELYETISVPEGRFIGRRGYDTRGPEFRAIFLSLNKHGPTEGGGSSGSSTWIYSLIAKRPISRR